MRLGAHPTLAEPLPHTWVLREPGSGTLAAVAAAPQPYGVALADLPQACQLENSGAISTWLRARPGTPGFLRAGHWWPTCWAGS